MRYIRDIGLLILYGFAALLFVVADPMFVLAFLTALIICCINYYAGSRPILFVGTGLYLIAAYFIPAFLYFIPAVAYVWFFQKAYLWIGGGLFLYLYRFGINAEMTWLIFFGWFGTALAGVIEYETKRYETLEEQFKKTTDDSRENNLILAEKNQMLLQNQDYEIYTATLKERNRIAREIHDNVGHMLSRSILMVAALKATNKEAVMKEPLTALDSTLNAAMDSIRSSVHDLHDEAINLEEAVKGLVREFTFCEVTYEYDMGRDVPREIKYCFISITKEAMSNIIKHSNAKKVRIIMREHPALYQLCIEDNGKVGFTQGRGIGLENMKERIQMLNGNIQFRIEKGFRIFITIPKGGQYETSNH